MENKFYVYVYLDPRKKGKYVYGEFEFDYEPFYVGKGHGRRWTNHLNKATSSNKNIFKLNKIRKIISEGCEPIVIKYKDSMVECDSFELEIDMINKIGRHDLKCGPLTNLSDGGEGSSGRKATINEIEFKRKVMNDFWSNITTEQRSNHSIKVSNANKGLIRTEADKEIKRQKSKEFWNNNIELKNKRRIQYSGDGNPNSKYKYVVYKNNEYMCETYNIRDFCEENDFPLSYVKSCIRKDGKYKQFKIIREFK